MPTLDIPEVPTSFKSIQHYLKIATEHDTRDPVVSYWARLYAAQTALGLTKKKTPEEANFLMKLMTWLEDSKKEFIDNEAVTNEVVAQAHLENWTLQLFLYADKNDRTSNFSRNVIQSFYTAGMLYDVITIFGELSEEAAQNRKYAKWKAAYIHNCLKNGEIPIPGPINRETRNDSSPELGETDLRPSNAESSDCSSVPDNPSSEENASPRISSSILPSPNLPSNDNNYNPTPTLTTPQAPSDLSTDQAGNVNLSSDEILKAQKYIKWAGSAINYEDISTAVENLQKALRLLTTGQDS